MTTASEARDGARDLLPALVASFPFGLLYGALATAKGMSPLEAVLASALVFAGSLQLASLELWAPPLPVAALALTALLVNARYSLMSASLAPKLGAVRRPGRLLALYSLADENWALAERRAAERPLTGAYVLTMGALLYVNWIGSTFLGTQLGPLLGDPARLGLDFAFTAIFIGLVAGFVTTRRAATVVAASAVASAGASVLFGPPWHVLAGAAAGIGLAAALPSGRMA